MDRPPKDPEARREWLERWAAEQRRIQEPEGEPTSRVKTAFYRAGTARRRIEWRLGQGWQRVADRLLDRGLNTAGRAVELEHDHPDRVIYLPSAWHVLPRALRYIGVSDQDTFVDFGCGKGRVVHQAAKHPFRRVIGVEVSPALAEIARAALAARRRQHKCQNVEIVVSDVADYRVPDDFTVGYLYHPFENETFDSLLQSIIDSMDRRPRRVRLIYALPAGRATVLASGRFRLAKEQGGPFDTSHSRVDIFESC
jgi:SAM-dependent methyltransferase